MVMKMRKVGPRPQRVIYEEDNHEDMDAVSEDFSDDQSVTNEKAHSQSDNPFIHTRHLGDAQKAASTPWYGSSKGLLLGLLAFLLISAAIVIPTVLVVTLTRNPSVASNATTTTTQATIARSAYWGFDNDATELYNIYNGALTNGATFSNVTYFNYGYNLALNSTVNQSVIITSSFFNLSYTSFTVEAWVYMRTVAGDNAVFSQCQCLSCQDQCLNLIIRNGRIYMGFTLDDAVGSTVMAANTWYHVAYVYDYSGRTQSVYVQGVLDQSRSSAGPYVGVNGSIVIGSSQLSSSSFNGYIDNLKLTTRAKSSAEVLAAGSVVVYLSFDAASLGQDAGPNQMNGTVSNCAVVTGRVGQAAAFSGSLSFIQIGGFYQLGLSNQPFSYAMWIFPYSITGGTLVHKATTPPTGGWCQDMMGLTFAGQIAFYTNGGAYQITGPFISVRQWTHIIYTFSFTNGQTMYINGVQYARTGSINFYSSGLIDSLLVGYNGGGCTPNPILGGYFLGALDEFYVYRRELTSSDAYTLANP